MVHLEDYKLSIRITEEECERCGGLFKNDSYPPANYCEDCDLEIFLAINN